MKKTLVVILSVLLVLGLSVSAFALHQSTQTEYEPGVASNDGVKLTLGGQLRVRGEIRENTWDRNDDNADRSAAYDARVRILLKAQTSNNTYGVIELESGQCSDVSTGQTSNIGGTDVEMILPCAGIRGEDSTGTYINVPYYVDVNSDVSDSYTWGRAPSGATGIYQEGNSKRGDLRVRQAYIVHQGKALGMLTGIKAGHMLLALGEGLFFDHTNYGDDAIVVWSEIPGSSGEISFSMVKLAEGNTRAGAFGPNINLTGSGGSLNAEADDANAYVLAVELPGDAFTVSGDITYLDDQDFTRNLPGTQIPGGNMGTEGLHFWNFGVRGSVNLLDNALMVRGDVEVQTGKAKQNYFPLPPDNPLIPTEREYNGYAWLVGADFDLNDMIDLNAEVAYGSGDKCDYKVPNIPDAICGGVDSGAKYEGFVNTLSGSQHYTYVYEYRVTSAAGATGTGLANTWYINVGGTVEATPDLSFAANFYFLQASKATALGGAMNDDGTVFTSKDIGTEIDAKIEYQIEKNLVYYIEGGYMFAGDAYDRPEICSATAGCGSPTPVSMGSPIPGANISPDNAYAVRHGLLLSF